jgi:hypothetical protein
MDAYLILTPLLVLGIIGLIRFIGCDVVLGLELRLGPVDALEAVAGDSRINLSWSYPATGPGDGFRIDVAGGPFDAVPPLGKAARSAEVTGLTNGTQYTFSVVVEKGSDVSAAVTISATPGVTSFVKDEAKISGQLRNNHSGFVGMEIMVGPNPIIVTQLGRLVAPTNSGVHQVKIAKPVTTPVPGQPVAGMDVVSASVPTVVVPDQSNVGDFSWVPLPQPEILEANTIYFVVSSELNGADLWYDEQPLLTNAVAALLSSIYTIETGADAGKYQRNAPGQVYVPVSFRY